MKRTALVIEDDPDIINVIADALASLGHEYDTACSQQEAARRLKANRYDYVLMDISIPARAQNGVARIQNTENLLEKLQELRGDQAPPVIIMTDYAVDDLKLTVNVMRLAMSMYRFGVVDVIAKPFPSAGRTLDRVIKKVLSGKVERVRIRWSGVPAGKEDDEEPPSPAPQAKAEGQYVSDRPAPEPAWKGVPNDPVTLDDFMARFCEHRSRDNRKCRKRALLAAARHKTVTLPALAAPRKHGQANKYFVQDLLAAWEGFRGEGVDLPPLLSPEAISK